MMIIELVGMKYGCTLGSRTCRNIMEWTGDETKAKQRKEETMAVFGIAFQATIGRPVVNLDAYRT